MNLISNSIPKSMVNDLLSGKRLRDYASQESIGRIFYGLKNSADYARRERRRAPKMIYRVIGLANENGNSLSVEDLEDFPIYNHGFNTNTITIGKQKREPDLEVKKDSLMRFMGINTMVTSNLKRYGL